MEKEKKNTNCPIAHELILTVSVWNYTYYGTVVTGTVNKLLTWLRARKQAIFVIIKECPVIFERFIA